MFGKLREKLKSFLGKSEEQEKPKKEKPEKKVKPEKKPEKVKSEKKAKEKKEKIVETLELEKKSEEIGEQPQEVAQEEKPEKQSFFSKIVSKIQTTTLKQEHVDEIFEPLEMVFLENNVALEVVDKIKSDLSKDLVGIEVKKGSIEQTVQKSLKDSISNVLIEPPNLLEEIKSKKGVYTIVFFGINGSGKTTSLAKLASYLKKNKISCILAAADTFRAASIEQLEKHASNLDVKVIKQNYGADPAAVAFDARKYAEKNNIKCVLVDTAGRMYTKENLIKEMEKIIRVNQPDLKIFVGESITGNDATEQARTFNEAIGIDGIILTKADVDEKGGTALSVSYITKKPIYFLGMGQNYEDLKPFKKQEILKNIGLD